MNGRSRAVVYRIVWAVGTAFALTFTPSSAGADSAPTGKIIFAGYPNPATPASSDLYSIRPDGSGLTNLSNTPDEFEQQPSLSPDGSKIAFRRGYPSQSTASTFELYTSDANFGKVTRITDNAVADEAPAWTPDGKSIVFMSNRNDPDPNCLYPPCNWDIFIMRADGTHVRQITSDRNFDAFPSVSPDGQKVLFTMITGTADSALYTINLDGTGLVRLTPPERLAADGEYSADGNSIVFVDNGCLSCPASDVWVMDANGSNPVRLTSSSADEASPTWSPDGGWIAFASGNNFSTQTIFVLRRDGSDRTQIAKKVVGFEPTWGP